MCIRDRDIDILVGGIDILQNIGQLERVVVLLFVGIDNLVSQLGDFGALHLSVIIVEEKNLQKPDKANQKQGETDKVHPEFKPYAFEIKLILQIQICNLLLSA